MLRSRDLLKLSGKESFKMLRSLAPFYSEALDSEIDVQRLFFHHISSSKKQRNIEELTTRVLMISLIPEIIKKGSCTENRKAEKNKPESYRISLKIKHRIFSVIIIRNPKNNLVVLSCFQDFCSS